MSSTRRAERLLKLYPPIWRERYGAEFVDFMEQSIADHPHSTKRAVNIFYKSFVTRLGELGIAAPSLDTANVSRAKLGTTTVLATAFTVFALFYWSYAMIAWNGDGRWPASAAVSLWTGAITVATILLVLTLSLIGFSFVWRALKRLIWDREKKFLWPLIMVLGSTVVVMNSIHQFTRFLIARGGIDWASPGWAIKQLAGVTLTATTSTIWGPSWVGGHLFTKWGLLYTSTPFAVAMFALGAALLIRRSEFSIMANRSSVWAAKTMAAEMVLFLISYAGWIVAGGPNVASAATLQPLTQMELSLLGVISLVAVLSVRASLTVRLRHSDVEIVSSDREST